MTTLKSMDAQADIERHTVVSLEEITYRNQTILVQEQTFGLCY